MQSAHARALRRGAAGSAVRDAQRLPRAAALLARSKMTGARTVPRVFVNGKCIGGGDDTAALAASGRLAKMLA